MIYSHRKRDLEYWLTKDRATWNQVALLKSEISILESYSKRAPRRRYPGKDRVLTRRYYSWAGGDQGVEKVRRTRTNRRDFAFRNHHQWKGAHVNWRGRIIKLARVRKRLKMIQDTKIPYYRERIKTLQMKQ